MSATQITSNELTKPIRHETAEISDSPLKPNSPCELSTRRGGRIRSMDQFRGYSVLGMFVVNFFNHLEITHQFFRHNNTHFSWADSIMPAFFVACGFSYRLSAVKHTTQSSSREFYRKIVRRSLTLVAISVLMYGIGGEFRSWAQMSWPNIRHFVAEFFKADMWEVLAIIGVSQILLLPFIQRRSLVRSILLVAVCLSSFLIAAAFNYRFVHALPNWMDTLWGTTGRRAWDGGFFGVVSWAALMLAGSLVYDLIQLGSIKESFRRLMLLGAILMLLGYFLSCLTRLYDKIPENHSPTDKNARPFSSTPIIPDWDNARGRPLGSLLAEPPFVSPPSKEVREWNYWMMDKRATTLSFILFSMGFSLAVYALFMVACDNWNWQSSVLKLVGQNALLAYILHYPILKLIEQIAPKDSPLMWSLSTFGIFLVVTLGSVRALVNQGVSLRV